MTDMNEKPKIPIKNIYYMLCYAWNILQQDDARFTGMEEFDNIFNLLARLMNNGVRNIIKRGFHREYQNCSEELVLIRGKIDVASSLRQQSFIRNQLVCGFDEFTYNVPFNQILKTTIGILMKAPYLDSILKRELMDIRYHFSSIDEIRITMHTFYCLKYNRNNMHYKMLMNICELIYFGLIANEQGKTLKFVDFIRNEQMAVLYEKFVLNFYKKHLPVGIYKTHSPKIEWGIDEEFEHVGLEYLPQMRTDIVIENSVEQTQRIIDTKYYASALGKGNFGDVRKLDSGNLYQICTYVNNSSYSGKVSGMLLYPTTQQELNLEYKISGKIIKIKTLNLASDWDDISESLFEIADAKRPAIR